MVPVCMGECGDWEVLWLCTMHALLMLSAVTAAVDNPVKGLQRRPSDDADRGRNRFLETIQSFYQNWVLSTLLRFGRIGAGTRQCRSMLHRAASSRSQGPSAVPLFVGATKSRYSRDFGSVRTYGVTYLDVAEMQFHDVRSGARGVEKPMERGIDAGTARLIRFTKPFSEREGSLLNDA
jgi:hypothetical protein